MIQKMDGQPPSHEDFTYFIDLFVEAFEIALIKNLEE